MIPGITASVISGAAPSPTFYATLLSSLTLTNGTAASTFVRNTLATVLDWEGLVKTTVANEPRFQGARRVENLVVDSEDFSVAGWSKTNITEATPKLTASAGNGTCLDAYTAIAGDYVFSIELQRVTGTGNIQIAADDGTYTTVTLTGAYQRFSVQQTVAAGAKNAGIRIVTSGDEVNAKNAQLELVEGQSNQNPSEYVSVGVESSPYHGANVDAVQYFETENGNTVASNVVTEATGSVLTTLDGYLNEELRTNLILQSEAFDNGSWIGSMSVTADAAVAPSGAITADELPIADAGESIKKQNISGASAATDYTISFWAKQGSATAATKILMTTNNFNSWNTGWQYEATLTSSWQRFTTTGQITSGTSLQIYIGNKKVDGTNDATVSGKALVWGVQVELGSFQTSYIPTTTTAVTRNADVLTYDYQPPALLGSMLLTYTPLAALTSGTNYQLCSNVNCRWAYQANNVSIRSYDNDFFLIYTTAVANAEINLGLTWEDGASPERAVYADGSQTDTGTLGASGYVSGSNPLGVGCRGDSGANQISGTYKEVKFYTDAKDQTFMEAAT